MKVTHEVVKTAFTYHLFQDELSRYSDAFTSRRQLNQIFFVVFSLIRALARAQRLFLFFDCLFFFFFCQGLYIGTLKCRGSIIVYIHTYIHTYIQVKKVEPFGTTGFLDLSLNCALG